MAAPAPTPLALERPRRPDGLELLGEYEGSGFRRQSYLVRRPDGQVVRLSRLLYLIASGADGRRGLPALAKWVEDRFGRPVGSEDVRFLIERKLRPAGVVASRNGSHVPLPRARPLLALRARAAVVPQPVIEAIAARLRPLFLPPVALVAMALLLPFEAWFLLYHSPLESLVLLAYDPSALLVVMCLTVLATVFHELGHATACSYGGARPGRLGVGIYLVWPVFYTDLTDTYRLDRAGRLRADLGGVYFNSLFVLACAAAYLVTGFEPLIAAMLIQHYHVLLQLLPVLRFDGHYVLSDLTGVPDILSRVGPALRDLMPGSRADPRVEELRPSVRRVVCVYALVTAAALTAALTLLVLQLPRYAGAALERSGFEASRVSEALAGADPITGLTAILGMIAVTLPLAGAALTFWLIARRLVRGAAEQGLGPRTLLWPERVRSVSALAWNLLFATASLLALTSLLLAVQGLAGVAIALP
jgi:putative peptide zinc metalloprotease protein